MDSAGEEGERKQGSREVHDAPRPSRRAGHPAADRLRHADAWKTAKAELIRKRKFKSRQRNPGTMLVGQPTLAGIEGAVDRQMKLNERRS